jgi:hypothetical protein
MSKRTYAGHTFVFRVDNGAVFRNPYTSDGTGLHYETLEGPGWVENGMTVTHVMNLNTHTVHPF